jgi:hypothetical protein
MRYWPSAKRSGRRLPLLLKNWCVDVLVIPLPRELLFPVLIDRGSDDGLDDVAVIADRGRGKRFRHPLDQLLQRVIVDLRQMDIPKDGIDPFVERVTARIDSCLLDRIAFAVGKGPEPEFPLLFER